MNIKKKMVDWSTMTFEDNPYGDKIPDVYLDSTEILKNGNTLRNIKQNGHIVSDVINDTSKKSFVENTNFVIFSTVFNRLLYDQKLCPSNYVNEVIKELSKYEFEHNKIFDKSVYYGYIARALRAFASYIREINLKEIITDYYQHICKKQGFSFFQEKDTYENKINEDVHNKTDIYFEVEHIPYRIWSYQSTNSGVECTLKRVLKSKKGINLYIPFNISTKSEFLGWYLYDETFIINSIKEIKCLNFADFKKTIIHKPFILKNINKVFVS